jgi:hypothetical protein
MESVKFNRKQQKIWELITQGWIPLQVSEQQSFYWVNSQSTFGYRYKVKKCPTLLLSCIHEYGDYNSYNPCSHIKAVQEHCGSSEGYQTFDQEVHCTTFKNSLTATKTKTQWEWMITDIRGGSIGCMGATVEGLKVQWWCIYNGNEKATWNTCQEAIDYLLGMTAF